MSNFKLAPGQVLLILNTVTIEIIPYKNNMFVAKCVEFPSYDTLGSTRAEALEDCMSLLECYLTRVDVHDVNFYMDHKQRTEIARRPRSLDGKDGPIFMGAGGYSVALCNLLHARLDYALSELSGMQQNGGMGSEFDEASDINAKRIIHEVIDDIKVALDDKRTV